jgi:hypothetical protein
VVVALYWVVILLTVFGSRFLYVSCEACGVREILGFLRMWRYRLRLFVEMCLLCYIFECQRIARIVCCSLIFYFLVRFFPLIRDTFVYFLCTRVAPFWCFLMNFNLSKKRFRNLSNTIIGEQLKDKTEKIL